MFNIAKLTSNVQSVVDFQQKIFNKKTAEGNDYAAQKHQITISELTEVIDFLETLPTDHDGNHAPSSHHSSGIDEQSSPQPDLFTLSQSELSEMPDSLLDALKLSKADELETKIIELIKIAGRPLSIKELIIGLYKKYNYEVPERNPFASKLYRMNSSGKIYSVPGKKGHYGLPEDKTKIDFM